MLTEAQTALAQSLNPNTFDHPVVEPDSVFQLWTVSEIFRSEERNVTRDEEQIEFG